MVDMLCTVLILPLSIGRFEGAEDARLTAAVLKALKLPESKHYTVLIINTHIVVCLPGVVADLCLSVCLCSYRRY